MLVPSALLARPPAPAVFRRSLASVIDEAFGLMLLHKVLRFADRPQVSGDAGAHFPDLHCGDPGRFFAPVPEPADLATHRRTIGRTPHAVVEDFAFASPVRTRFPRNGAVRGREWRAIPGPGESGEPERREPGAVPRSPAAPDPGLRKTLVLIDGLVQLGYGNERLFADHLNPVGISVVTIDLPFNHRRTPAGYRPGQLIVGGDLDHALGVMRQAVLDTWALVRGLQAEGRSVSLAGISLGGWTVLSTALVAPGISSVTAIAPPVDMLRVLTEGGAIVRAARRGLRLSPAEIKALRPVARAVTPSAWPPPLPPGRVFLHAADFDRFVPTCRILALADEWHAALTRYPVGHMQLTSFPLWLGKVADAVRESAWPAGG